jgi:hypothetical protein
MLIREIANKSRNQRFDVCCVASRSPLTMAKATTKSGRHRNKLEMRQRVAPGTLVVLRLNYSSIEYGVDDFKAGIPPRREYREYGHER